MIVFLGFIILASLFSGFGHPVHTPPKEIINLAVGTKGEFRERISMIPEKQLNTINILKQNYDYSCGSAALGTLLNGFLGENLTERQIIKGLMKFGDKDQIIRLRAFSLWDMQQFVTALGYDGAGYNGEMDDLKNPEHWPCIVPISLFNYRHFVVLKGVHKDHVFVADPWKGNTSYPLKDFERMWYDNILFKVFPKNGKKSSLLALKEKDMRFIDPDDARKILMDIEAPFQLSEELKTKMDFSNLPYEPPTNNDPFQVYKK